MAKGTSMFGLLGMEVNITTPVLLMAMWPASILLASDLLIRMEDKQTMMKTALPRWLLHLAITLIHSHHIMTTGTSMIRSILLLWTTSALMTSQAPVRQLLLHQEALCWHCKPSKHQFSMQITMHLFVFPLVSIVPI